MCVVYTCRTDVSGKIGIDIDESTIETACFQKDFQFYVFVFSFLAMTKHHVGHV